MDPNVSATMYRGFHLGTKEPRLIAASKTKPKEAIIAAYNNGQQHFGENYVQELVEKGNDPEVIEKCKNIRWHFIGHLQRNKINKVIATPNIYMVETVDSEKLAAALNSAWAKASKDEKLRIMVQVNTSTEESKSGIDPKEVSSLVEYVLSNCPDLKLCGLMTIGAFGYDLSNGPNPDFQCLAKCRQEVCDKFNFDINEFDMSMGMSHDFEHAIEMGSTNVRVGTTIFGERTYSN